MSIKQFLIETIGGKLSEKEQLEFLKQHPFGSTDDQAGEIAEAVEYLMGQMNPAPTLEGAIDLCGTGGSGLARINTSTISAFIVAAAGVAIAKHGNNAASGRFGSFDLLQALDIPIDLSIKELELRFKTINLAFLYARSFHPAMKHFAGVRAQISNPTFFNILGPLLSPVRASRQLIGTPRVEFAEIIANVCNKLGKERVIVVSGSDGLDDVTTTGSTAVFELNKGKITRYEILPEDFGIERTSSFRDLATRDSQENIALAKRMIKGEYIKDKTELVLVNSALALYLADFSNDLKECYKKAKEIYEEKLQKNIYENYKNLDILNIISNQDKYRVFNSTSNNDRPTSEYSGGIIAEIKRASPSEGDINLDLDLIKQAKIYESAGASAISVLCEPKYFKGSFDDLAKVKNSVNLPILAKDFFIRSEHIDAAKAAGADMILLIMALLDDKTVKELKYYSEKLGMQTLIEVHNLDELKRALKLEPKIIGVNCRDLKTFKTDKNIFDELSGQIPKSIIKVAESGISNFSDAPKDYQGILVGTQLMQHPFPELKIKELSGRPLIKLCGIRTVEAAIECENNDVDLIGINFVPRSKRKVSVDLAREISAVCKSTVVVGVFEDQTKEQVNEIAKASGVKAIQLSGSEKDLSGYDLPIIKTIKPGDKKPGGAFLAIIDNDLPGSGKKIDIEKLNNYETSLIAGGVDLKRAQELFTNIKPVGIDTASGIETAGKTDLNKIKAFADLSKNTHY